MNRREALSWSHCIHRQGSRHCVRQSAGAGDNARPEAPDARFNITLENVLQGTVNEEKTEAAGWFGQRDTQDFCSDGVAVSSDSLLEPEEQHRASDVLSWLPAVLENSQLRERRTNLRFEDNECHHFRASLGDPSAKSEQHEAPRANSSNEALFEMCAGWSLAE
ncbi:hypothetical protein AV530_011089 [Patagioenas fasciata monilis]|uniref:Uncharacterized protein n=1 Tax=Patagioenas fasciata monilis TaxID=372326 RepID=A0A1V4JVR8_PATFA|nr:hypothetical protein AV530_011089 [Patagioenas fasciata monilis]